MSKKQPARPDGVPDEKLAAWAEKELASVEPLIDEGHAYLEGQLRRLCKKDDNAAEVMAICKYLWQRQDRAAALRDRGARAGGLGAAAGQDPGRYDLSRLVEPDAEG